MTMMYIFAAFLACFLHTNAWLNEWDQQVNFQCPDGHHISRIQSYHHNGKEDRRWQYECRPGYVDPDSRAACTWSDYVNSLDGDMNFICPSGKILTGFQSKHDNGAEDRRWKVRCCSLITKPGKNCQWSGYINEMDKEMDHRVPSGAAIVGVYSYHSNGAEDRRWKLRICDFTSCKAQKITILDNIQPSRTADSIVGIVVNQECRPGGSPKLISVWSKSVTEEQSLETTQGNTFTWNTEISVESETTVGALGSGGSVSFGVTASAGGALTAESSETLTSSSAKGSTSQNELYYRAPGAAMTVTSLTEYTLDSSSVNTAVDVQCDDGTKYTEKRVMTFSSKTYGKVHYTNRVGTFNANQCGWNTLQCVSSIQGENAVTKIDTLLAEFDACFQGKGKTFSK